jgi:tetratricopeptide (TPR) repeat protein
MSHKFNFAAWLVISTISTTLVSEPPKVLAAVLRPSLHAALETSQTDATRQYQQGLTAVAAGNLPQAIGSFDRAIELDPDYVQAYIERGNAKDNISDLAGAISDYTKAISLDANQPSAYYNRGTVLSKSGKKQEAIVDYTKALSINSEYSQAYLNRGNELDDLGDTAGALADYDRAIQIRPNYALAYLNRGITHERVGNRAKAIADLKQAADLFKSNGDVDKYRRAQKMIRDIQSEV